MGQYDRKNYILKVGIRECCTDQRYIDFMTEKDFNYTIEEVSDFIKSTIPQHNPLAERIVRYFIDYKGGELVPDKFDRSEPMKISFEINNITEPVAILSFAGGQLYISKKRCYSAVIENESYNFVWEDKKSFKPNRPLPEYMVNIKIFFSKQRKPKMEFMQQLADDMAAYFDTDYAKIIDQEIASEMPPLYEKDPKAVIYDAVDK